MQDIIHYGDEGTKREFFRVIRTNMMRLSVDIVGHRVANAAIRELNPMNGVQLARELQDDLAECSVNCNAHHVLQCCIQHLPSRGIEFMLKFFAGRASELVVSQPGSR